MSQIKSVLGTLASASVSAGAVRVTGHAQATLRQAEWEPPVRVLSVMHGAGMTPQAGTFGASAAMKVQWTVHDLLLWRPVGQGEGLAQYEVELTDYMAGYVDFIRANRLQGVKVVVEAQSVTPGIYEWPAGSGNKYVGVDATLTVNEVI